MAAELSMSAPTPTATTTTPVTAPSAIPSAEQQQQPAEEPSDPQSTNAQGSSSSSSSSTSPVENGGSTTNPPPPIPVRTKDSFQKLLLERYISRDAAAAAGLYEASLKDKSETAYKREKTKEYARVRHEYRPWFPPSKLYGEGYQGFGNLFTENNATASSILYPVQKPRPNRGTVQKLRWSRKQMRKQAEAKEELVPVRLDVDWDKVKLRDTFTWNAHDRTVPLELFAAQLVEDMGLEPPASRAVFDIVVAQMREQISDFYPFVFSEEDALDPELPYSAYKNDEMRMLVKINITIGQHTLVDQFEWDINNPLNSPEDFANGMARDLSLPGEFATAIAHSIREQTQLFTRSLYGVGHPFDGRPVEDPDLVAAFLPSPLPSVFRAQQQAKEYAPFLWEMTEADLEKNETIFSREQRRQKRSVNRRGGPQLPDLKERQRTIRTLVVSSVLPGAARNVEESKLYKKAAGTGAGRKRGFGARGDGDISDSDESEDSSPDSPAPSAALQGGTARTRGMRGAASAAQQRMANLGRSETPEASITHHHETRTSRRFGRELHDQSEEPQRRLVVTLRVSPERLRRVLAGEMRVAGRRNTPSVSASPAPSHRARPSVGFMDPPATPVASGSAIVAGGSTPTTAPGQGPRPQPSAHGTPQAPNRDAPTPPPPPEWLVSALADLGTKYPDDLFEPIMRYSAVHPGTEQVYPPGQPVPADAQYVFLPRVRCKDCPGKTYNPGADKSVSNFEIHLKNKMHKEKVARRLGR